MKEVKCFCCPFLHGEKSRCFRDGFAWKSSMPLKIAVEGNSLTVPADLDIECLSPGANGSDIFLSVGE